MYFNFLLTFPPTYPPKESIFLTKFSGDILPKDEPMKESLPTFSILPTGEGRCFLPIR